MHTLHTRAASIFSSWAEEEQRKRSIVLAVPGTSCQDSLESIDAGASSLWLKCWCPLLQGQWSLPPGIKQKRSFKHNYLSRNLVFDMYISTAFRSLLQQTEVTDVSHDQCHVTSWSRTGGSFWPKSRFSVGFSLWMLITSFIFLLCQFSWSRILTSFIEH